MGLGVNHQTTQNNIPAKYYENYGYQCLLGAVSIRSGASLRLGGKQYFNYSGEIINGVFIELQWPLISFIELVLALGK